LFIACRYAIYFDDTLMLMPPRLLPMLPMLPRYAPRLPHYLFIAADD